jgi:hypothetical protein
MAMKLIDHIDHLSEVDHQFVTGVYKTLDTQAAAEDVIQLSDDSDDEGDYSA